MVLTTPRKEPHVVNRPKQIGTAAETAVVRVLADYFPGVKREPLRGARDQGDIRTGDVIWEVKGGKTARGAASTGSAGPGLLAAWMEQTAVEKSHAGSRIGVLVTARAGFGASRARSWWAYLRVDELALILGADGHRQAAPVRLELGQLLDLMADCGWADAT